MTLAEINEIVNNQCRRTNNYQKEFFLSPEDFESLLDSINFIPWWDFNKLNINSREFILHTCVGTVTIYKLIEEYKYRIYVSDTQYFDLKYKERMSKDDVITDASAYRKMKLNDGNYWIPGGIIRIEELE